MAFSALLSLLLLVTASAFIFPASHHLLIPRGACTSLSAGFGAAVAKGKKTKPAPFDAKSSLLKSEELYDRLSKEYYFKNDNTDDSDEIEDHKVHYEFREFVVTARCAKSKSLHDWVPFANLCTLTSKNDVSDLNIMPILNEAVKTQAREIVHAAQCESPQLLQNVNRQDIEFAGT